MFKKRTMKYNNSSSNLKNSIANYESNRPSHHNSYSYLLNKSEPLYFTPQINNRNIAYLMTPCYIVDNDEINNKNIKEYNKKYGKDIINGYYLSKPNKEKIFYRTKSTDGLNNNDPFFNLYMKNVKNDNNNKRNKNNDKYSSINKIKYPYKKNFFVFDKDINPIERDNKYINIKRRPISSDKKNKRQNRLNNDFDYEQFPRYIDTNRKNYFFDKYNKKKQKQNQNDINISNENDFTLGHENKNIKIITRNKSNNLNHFQESGEFNPFNYNNNYQNQNINREILNQLYENNFMGNKKKQNFQIHTNNNKSNDKYKNKNKNNNNIINSKNNVIGLNTERKNNKKYSIFENYKFNTNGINKSRDYLLPIKQNNNEMPYNKIFNKDIFSSSNFSLINSQKEKGKIPFNKDNKKINSSTSMNNNSHNSNSQSNNIGVNHISTNYSIGPGGHSYYSSNKDSKKLVDNSTNNNKNNSKIENIRSNNIKPPIHLEISPGIVDEYYRDSIGKKSNSSSNRISMQSLNDSKMWELAGHYGLGDESSSDNYQMSTVIHNKKKFYRNNKDL